MQTRKYIDFVLWALLIIISKHSLSKNDEVFKLILNIKNNINRYCNNNQGIPSVEELIYILSLTLKFDPKSLMPRSKTLKNNI